MFDTDIISYINKITKYSSMRGRHFGCFVLCFPEEFKAHNVIKSMCFFPPRVYLNLFLENFNLVHIIRRFMIYFNIPCLFAIMKMSQRLKGFIR